MLTFLFTKTPLKFFIQSLWRDEAFSYLLAKQNPLTMFALTVKDANPPLYYLILHYWMLIFGQSEIAIRSLSFIFYLGTIVVVYEFFINILKVAKLKSLLYLLVILLNPILTYYAFEARMYSMMAFFGALSFYSYLKSNPRIYIFSTVLALCTHYFLVFIPLIQFIHWMVYGRKIEQSINFKTFSFIGLLFLPWLTYLLLNRNIPSNFWVSPSVLSDVLYLPMMVYTGFEKDFISLSQTISTYLVYLKFFSIIILLTVSIGFLRLRKLKHDLKLFWIFVLWSFFPAAVVFLVSFYQGILVPRYLIFSSVGILLLILYVIKFYPRTFQILILSFLIFFSFIYQQQQIKYRKKSNTSKTFDEIKGLAKKDDLLYVENELDFHLAEYYFDDTHVYIYNKPYADIPWYVGKVLIPENKVTNQLPIYPQKAFVIKKNGDYTIAAASN